MNRDEQCMHAAIHQALRGVGTTSPNPAVGAVVWGHGKILSKAYHHFAGGPHAEVLALRRLKRVPKDATLYVTMEPCSTAGRTPACTGMILQRGVRRVVIGSLDPNPLHHGRAVRILRRQGLRVVTGIAAEACEKLNPAFAKYITRHVPLATAKMAMSLDGKVATRSGMSRWISCEASRAMVQRMRHAADAVLVGAGTVRRDNPRLTLRARGLSAKRRPWVRIVADSTLSLSPGSRIFTPVKGHATWIATTQNAFRRRAKRYLRKGIEILRVKASGRGILLRDLWRQLGRRQISSVLIEGGPTLLSSCLQEKVLDRLVLFVAPVLIGGNAAPGLFGGRGVATLRQASALKHLRVSRVGTDLLLEAEL